MSLVNYGLRRGQRAAQAQRPATLTYDNFTIPCTPGNLDFFMRLKSDGGGFQNVQHLFVTVLRTDIPPDWMALREPFHSGHNVTITNTDPDSPDCGEAFELVVGQNNSWSGQLLILNLEKLLA